ncbi:MAG TPA: ribonuclease P [archaeon]|nr:ribonuclease P [archaeon]
MSNRKISRKPEWQIKVSKERIEKLLEMARKDSVESPGLSRRYVSLALKIGMRFNVRLPKEQKKAICKNCNSYLIPGKTSTVRASKKQRAIVTTCRNCGSIKRHPYRKEKQKTKAPDSHL